jgi:Uncharacterized conserved protein
MWTCGKCGRRFEKVNQEHYCGESPKTIEAYISIQAEEVQPRLNAVRETLQNALPDAQERISWSMPTYWEKRNIIHFAAFKKHIGIYPCKKAVAHFADRLND